MAKIGTGGSNGNYSQSCKLPTSPVKNVSSTTPLGTGRGGQKAASGSNVQGGKMGKGK